MAGAREIIGVKRDAAGRLSHLVLAGGGAVPIEEILRDPDANAYFFTRQGESLLVELRRVDHEIFLVNPLQGRVDPPTLG